MKYRFLVEGMTCAVCSASVEKVVSRLPGVHSAAVNLSAKTLICQCENTVKPEDVIRKIEAAGFSATLATPSAPSVAKGGASLKIMVLSLVFLVPLMYLSMGEMLGVLVPHFLSRAHAPLVNVAVLCALSALVMGINYGFFVRGVAAVRRRSANMDTLVSLGSAAAFAYSVLEVCLYLFGAKEAIGALYFESAAMILALVDLGKFLEERAKNKTASALQSLMDLAPKTVRVLHNGVEVEVPAEQIVVGDEVLVRPGERIAVDGTVQEGQSTLDTSALTGESLPQDVSVGDEVLAGAINLSGALSIRAAKSTGESTLSQMIALVEEAGVSRAPAARLADKVASIFVPTVATLSLCTVFLWLIFGYPIAFSIGLGISVLVVSCPCALGLATPVAVTAALGTCALRGVLVRDAAAFDKLLASNTVVLDKTGTVTLGQPCVTDVFSCGNEEELLRLAASIEEYSEHPLARAVCRFTDLERVKLSGFEAVFGKGVCAFWDGKRLLGGNAVFLLENGVDTAALQAQSDAALAQGKTILYFALDGMLLGALALADAIKPTSPAAVEELKQLGRRVVMLTGDRAAAANAIAQQCKIEHVVSEVLPQSKAGEVVRLQAQGAVVAMVGDGINDAPALASAEIGISLGNGSDIAQNCADVILLSGDLQNLPRLIRYSRRVRRVVRQNLFWAFFYNCCMIPVAAGALFVPLGLTLNPMIASACMSLSSLFVVTNALRLYRRKES